MPLSALRPFLPWLAALAAACGLVAPLGDYEPPVVTPAGGSGGGGGVGATGGTGAPEGGDSGASSEAGTAGTAEPAVGGTAGEAGSGPAGGKPGCTSNAECSKLANGAPSRCSETGKCVALRTGACPLVYDDEGFKAADPIYVGAFAPLNPAVPESSAVVPPLELALDELSGDAYGGLVMPNGKRRPIVLVVCDNSEDSVDPAAKHLFDSVGVSAVLATLLPGDLRRVFDDYADRNAFFLSPVGATSAIANLEDDDLVWTMLGQPKDLVPVYRDLVANLVEPYIRNVRGIGDRPLKVVLLRGSDAFGLELSSLVVKALTWNGKSLAKNDEDGNYRGYTFDGSKTPEEIAKELLSFVPDLVISTAGEEVTEGTTGFIEQLESLWGLVPGDVVPPRPFYVLSPFNAGDLGALKQRLMAELDDPAYYEPGKRFIGVTAALAEDQSLQTDFARNLKDKFTNAVTDTGNYYDAFYFLAYALYGARVDRPQGKDIARGMHRLLSGQRFEVGLADIPYVLETLADESSSIELDGTLGPPAFDPNGVHIDPGAVYCVGASESLSVYTIPNALRYEPGTRTFKGEFPCFDDFFP